MQLKRTAVVWYKIREKSPPKVASIDCTDTGFCRIFLKTFRRKLICSNELSAHAKFGAVNKRKFYTLCIILLKKIEYTNNITRMPALFSSRRRWDYVNGNLTSCMEFCCFFFHNCKSKRTYHTGITS